MNKQELIFIVATDCMDDGTIDGINKGDLLRVREINPQSELDIKNHPFWLVASGNNVLLRQIVDQDEEKGTITLHSLNPSPEYTDQTISINEVLHLYCVRTRQPKYVFYGGWDYPNINKI